MPSSSVLLGGFRIGGVLLGLGRCVRLLVVVLRRLTRRLSLILCGRLDSRRRHGRLGACLLPRSLSDLVPLGASRQPPPPWAPRRWPPPAPAPPRGWPARLPAPARQRVPS